jgi:hypothetical protein
MTFVGVDGALTFWAITAPGVEANANAKPNERTSMDGRLPQAEDSNPDFIGA